MNRIDTYGRWFLELEKRNENSLGMIGFYKNKDSLETRAYPHSRYDAVSILMEYLAEQGIENYGDHVPDTLIRNTPGYFKQIMVFIRYFRNIKKLPKPRKMCLSSKSWPENPVKIDKSRLAWRVFEKEETQNILIAARKRNSNLNSYCLSKLVANLDDIWVNKENDIVVGIPVSLHKSLEPELFPRNRFSFLDIQINETLSASEIKEIIKKNISENKHYALWVGSNLPKLLGNWFYGYFLSVAPSIQFRNILFSNAGNWCRNSDEAAFIIPPVLHYHPISAGVITWGGKLAITIHVHPHLKINNNLEKIISSWSEDLLESESTPYWASSVTSHDANFRYCGSLI